MNIRHSSPGQVKSALYFALFEVFKAAGIEIPFPQQDVHIRSSIPWPPMQSPENTIDDINKPSLSGTDTHNQR